MNNIQNRPVFNSFQSSISKKIKDIHASKDVIVKADKTTNLYKVPIKDYKSLELNLLFLRKSKTSMHPIKDW